VDAASHLRAGEQQETPAGHIDYDSDDASL
jgi:hypothetical protein